MAHVIGLGGRSADARQFHGRGEFIRPVSYCRVRCTIYFVVVVAMIGSTAHAADIWLSAFPRKEDPSDFMNLFDPAAPWKQAISKVKVFKVLPPLLLTGSEDDLRKVFASLREHHIELAVELGLLSGVEGKRCGYGMEGFAAQRTAAVLAERTKKLGGDLAYIAMDEPLWMGHFANGPTACHASVEDIARTVAEKIRDVRAVFPNVRIGDAEPVGVPDNLSWPTLVHDWLGAYRQVTGSPLAFFHADMQWNGKWQQQVTSIANISIAAGIPFGVIVDSDRPETDGGSWVGHAERRYFEVQSALGGKVSQAIVQSWTAYPKRLLPESDPGTLTNLVLRVSR